MSAKAGDVVTVLHCNNDWMFCRVGNEVLVGFVDYMQEGYLPARMLDRIEEEDCAHVNIT